jgi:tyrosyl-tRNA synthetase
VLDLMMKCKLAPSKKEARRLVEQGGVEVNGEKVAAPTTTYTADDLSGDGLMIKKGKKVFHRAQM